MGLLHRQARIPGALEFGPRPQLAGVLFVGAGIRGSGYLDLASVAQMKLGAMFKTKRASEIRTPAFLPKMWNVSVSADTRDHLIFLRTLRSCPNRRSFRDGNAFVLAVRLLLAGLSALSDVDAALEVRAIFNRNACRNDVAG